MFFYLLTVVPAIWFLELNAMEKRIDAQNATLLAAGTNETEEELRSYIAAIGVCVILFTCTIPMESQLSL